ncbi:MAG: sporulation protein [Saprospiraceae bacterium]
MFKKVKKWLGIEGVKLELVLPELAFIEVGAVSGKIRFYSKNEQTVKLVKLVMIEKYSRGRGNERLVDEYVLGELKMDKTFDVPAENMIEIGFTLPFQKVNAPIDEFGDKNVLAGGLTKLAKAIRNVKSEYRIEAEAKVVGTALNPFDKKTIRING